MSLVFSFLGVDLGKGRLLLKTAVHRKFIFLIGLMPVQL
jgi:hypothetical protein